LTEEDADATLRRLDALQTPRRRQGSRMMRNVVALGIAFLAVAWDVRAVGTEECLREFVPVDVVRALVTAKTVASLDAIRAEEDFRSNVTVAVYALRLYELSKTRESESRLLESIPRSDVELLLLYRLTDPDIALPERRDLFADYMQAVYDVVRRSPRRYGAFLRLGVLARGGELGETVSTYIQRLYESDTTGVDRALMKMPEGERKLVCGEEAVPCPRAKLRKD
jgi:hypothetical protein